MIERGREGKFSCRRMAPSCYLTFIGANCMISKDFIIQYQRGVPYVLFNVIAWVDSFGREGS